MLSKKTKYGLQALFFLAKRYPNRSILIGDLAKEENIPQKFLESILLDLKNHGLLISKKGKGGGYTLAKSPNDISIGEVVQILEGPLVEASTGDIYEIKILSKEIQQSISSILDTTSLSDAMSKSQLLSKNTDFVI